MDADYWYRNLREPVRFYDALVQRLAAGECTFVELSPHPVLAPAITDTLAQTVGRTQSAVITTLHRDRPDQDALATALAALHNHGHSPSWSACIPTPAPSAAHLPVRAPPLLAGPHLHRRRSRARPGPCRPSVVGRVAELADQDQVMVSGRLSPGTQAGCRPSSQRHHGVPGDGVHRVDPGRR